MNVITEFWEQYNNTKFLVKFQKLAFKSSLEFTELLKYEYVITNQNN